ncbi:MAG: valine--tRNA ligase [Pyrinomonadaceae bacterium]
MEIPKTYDPKQAEESHYARWEREGCFAPEANRDAHAPVYTIVIPPPNVTGSLHMGHALQHTIMDVLTRYHRMRGFRTLWLPGTDHAGISTQIMVERHLKKEEGKTRHDLGREEFIERVWKWKEQYGGEITQQMRREGASVDWSRERFTMDEHLSRAVREVFVRLYEKKLIRRNYGIVNWCPKDQTVLSDLEVDKEPFAGKLYYLRYPVKGREGRYVTVATTRPETMLGDTAVAVHLEDERYADLIDADIELPLTGRQIRVVADLFVDPKFGTGAVKVTPAHDPNDYEIGLRHGLLNVFVIDKNARMTKDAGAEFAGLDRYEAREKVVEKFKDLGLLEKVEDYEFAISRCSRCRTVIEPLILKQWFCTMLPLKQPALFALLDEGKPKFIPETPYTNVYRDWLINMRDWPLSRQLWWGHQIPAWYTVDDKEVVARSEEEARQGLSQLPPLDEGRRRHLEEEFSESGDIERLTVLRERREREWLVQDPDVLDTWFSSALWPFSTLGWPDEDAPDLKTFYPTSVLVTARDIIFLWVSRMVMTGLEFVDSAPFRDVFVTGTVFDKHGQRMSKTKGNGVNPLDVFDKYGVDATRLVLASIGSTDTRWNDNQVESYRNFANKIWNAARFCLMNSEGAQVGRGFEGEPSSWSLHDRWILSRLNKTARDVGRAIEEYQFHEAVYALYHFFWDDFCDWYIELSKSDVTAAEASPARDASRSRVLTVLEQALRLLHPFMPFITEELWQRLPGVGADSLHAAYRSTDVTPTVMLAEFPRADDALIDERAETEMRAVIELISRVRNIRTELNIKPSEHIQLQVGANDKKLLETLKKSAKHIERIARVASTLWVEDGLQGTEPRAAARAALTGGVEIAVPLFGLIDFTKERERLKKERMKIESELEKLEKQLGNTQFVERAPAEKVEELRQRAADFGQRTVALEQMLEALGE